MKSDFFPVDAARLYDFVSSRAARMDIEFFAAAAKRAEGPVLDIGCGTGRILLPMAAAGAEVVGLDFSENMLAICRERLQGMPPEVQQRVRLEHADMRAFELDRRFALATCPFHQFQHMITLEDQLASLACIHRHLADNGQLILVVFNPDLRMLLRHEVGEEYGDEAEFRTPQGERVIRRHRIIARDVHFQTNHIEHIFYVTRPDGQQDRLVHSFPVRYFFRFELEHLLYRCGFRVEELYADHRMSPYGSTYPGELVFMARKN
jgi:SAM-dependent methyltransferase